MVSIAVMAAVSIPMTIPLAWLLHVFVEDPVLRARPRIAGITRDQNRCVTPARIVRRSPYCGAPTLTPVPLRIS